MNTICFRYAARIHELRKEGYVISTIPEKGSIHRFVLHDKLCNNGDEHEGDVCVVCGYGV